MWWTTWIKVIKENLIILYDPRPEWKAEDGEEKWNYLCKTGFFHAHKTFKIFVDAYWSWMLISAKFYK